MDDKLFQDYKFIGTLEMTKDLFDVLRPRVNSILNKGEAGEMPFVDINNKLLREIFSINKIKFQMQLRLDDLKRKEMQTEKHRESVSSITNCSEKRNDPVVLLNSDESDKENFPNIIASLQEYLSFVLDVKKRCDKIFDNKKEKRNLINTQVEPHDNNDIIIEKAIKYGIEIKVLCQDGKTVHKSSSLDDMLLKMSLQFSLPIDANFIIEKFRRRNGERYKLSYCNFAIAKVNREIRKRRESTTNDQAVVNRMAKSFLMFLNITFFPL
jgi:hypothetical protein